MADYTDKQIGVFMQLLSDITKNLIDNNTEEATITKKITSFAYGIIGQLTLQKQKVLEICKHSEKHSEGCNCTHCQIRIILEKPNE